MTAPAPPDRDADLAAFYKARHRALIRLVAYTTRNNKRTVIDDACAYAWLQLVRRTDIGLDRHGYSWLAAVAIHEACRLARAPGAYPAGLLRGESEESGEIMEPAGHAADPADRGLEAEEHQARVTHFSQLKPAQRHALLLHAGGYRYQEIAALTHCTYTAVNRRLTEGRAHLRRLQGANNPAGSL